MERKTRIISVLLSAVIFLSTFFGLSFVSAVEPVLTNEDISEHILGDYIYNYDFSSMKQGDAIPADWDYSFRYPGITWGGMVESSVGTAPTSCDGYINWNPDGYTHIMTLPALGTDNYMVSVEIAPSNTYGSFGLVTDVPNDYTTAQAVIMSQVYCGNGSTKYDHYFKMNDRFLSGKNGSDGNDSRTVEAQTAKYFICDDSGNCIDFKADVKIELTVIHYNGFTSFYVNGILVDKIADTGKNKGVLDRVGIVDTGSYPNIYSVTAREVLSCAAGDVLLSEDFSDEAIGTALPEGWTGHYYDGIHWDYKVENQTTLVTEVKEENGERYLEMSGSADQAVTLPALGTENYILSAEVMLKSSHSFGLLTDILNDYKNTKGYTASLVYCNNESIAMRMLAKAYNGKDGTYNDYTTVGIGLYNRFFDDGVLNFDERITLTVTHYSNVTNFYVNGVYVTSFEDRNTTELSDCIAFFGCSPNGMRIYSVEARRLSIVGIPDSGTTAEEYVRNGDINRDNSVNILDLVHIKKMAANVYDYTNAADMDFNSTAADSDDIAVLKKRLLGVETGRFYVLNSDGIMEKLKLQGRWQSLPMGITLDWTASSLEFAAECEGKVGIVVNTTITAENPEDVLYFAGYVDGVRIEDAFVLKKGINYLKLTDDLAFGKHTFTLTRMTDAVYGNVEAVVVELDGNLTDNSKSNTMIEFIGDSITVGGGNLGSAETNSDIGSNPSMQDGTRSYAHLTARALGYDYSISARTGIALYYGYGYSDAQADTFENFYNIYNIQNYYRDKTTKYVPNRESDIICINLGTNDYWSNTLPDDNAFTAKMVDFVSIVKRKSPHARIVLITGGINDKSKKAVTAAAQQLGGETSGVYLCHLTSWLTAGANTHPSVAQHELMAQELTAFIKTIDLEGIVIGNNTYNYVWGDEFDGNALDSTKWTYDVANAGMTSSDPDVMMVLSDKRVIAQKDGTLRLMSKVIGYNTNGNPIYGVPASVSTHKKMSYTYGYCEIKAKVPFGKGLWPGFWATTDSYFYDLSKDKYLAEIDVFEIFGCKDGVTPNIHKWYKTENYDYAKIHGGNSNHTQFNGYEYNHELNEVYMFAERQKDISQLSNEYHVYGFEWTPTEMSMYIDGEKYMTYDITKSYDRCDDMSGFHNPISIMFNNHLFIDTDTFLPDFEPGVPSSIQGSEEALPSTFEIDYFRLYQSDGVSGNKLFTK